MVLYNELHVKEWSKTYSGFKGEQLVVDKLQRDGYTIVARNYRKRFGEVDIVAHRHELLCFVEVKFRTDPLFDPTELISFTKQKRIVAAAKDFLLHSPTINDVVCRFDVALVTIEGYETNIVYIENAFTE